MTISVWWGTAQIWLASATTLGERMASILKLCSFSWLIVACFGIEELLCNLYKGVPRWSVPWYNLIPLPITGNRTICMHLENTHGARERPKSQTLNWNVNHWKAILKKHEWPKQWEHKNMHQPAPLMWPSDVSHLITLMYRLEGLLGNIPALWNLELDLFLGQSSKCEGVWKGPRKNRGWRRNWSNVFSCRASH